MTIYWDRMPPGDQWDQHLLERLLDGTLYPHHLDIKQVDEDFDCESGQIAFIPGRYWADRIDEVNEMLSGLKWVLAFRTSDESDWFDVAKVSHPNIRWWVQNPRVDREYGDARLIGCGFPAHFDHLMQVYPDKKHDVFLSAQNNHRRRHECFGAFQEGKKEFEWWVASTEGFTQGFDPDDYADHMAEAKIAPCPAGVFTPDSFRVFEALEAHAIPIADDISPNEDYDSYGYWQTLFPDAPFPILMDWRNAPGWIADLLANWPHNANQIVAWWMRQKRKYAHWLVEDLKGLGAI